MRYYIDEDLPPIIGDILRARGIDAVSCRDVSWYGRRDPELSQDTAQGGRCVVTKNRDDFQRLTTTFAEQGLPHAEVVIVPRSIPREQFNVIADALTDLHQQFPDGVPPYTPLCLRRRPPAGS